jgi:hypothetical protein
MAVELSHVWQGNVFILETHYAVRHHLSHICMPKKVQYLDIQERQQSFRKKVTL